MRTLLLITAAACLLSSCAGPPIGASAALLFFVALLAGACSIETTPVGGASDIEAADAADVEVRPDLGAGTWERCCQGDQITTCFCPENVSCNYGWFTDCGDGTCSAAFGSDVGGVCGPEDMGIDSGPDLGPGRWEPCCQSGQVTTCFCPEGAACNYGWFTDCGDGTCTQGPGDAGGCGPDAGPVD